MKNWIVSKIFSEIAVRFDWTLKRMWNEIRKNFRNLIYRMRSRRLSRRIIFSRQFIDFDAERKKIKRYKLIRIQISLSFNQLSIIKSKIVNCTKSNSRYWKQQTMKSSNHVFFESFTKMIFRFLTQIDYESKKTNFDAKITITVIFQFKANAKITITIFFQIKCENRDYNDFSNFKKETIFVAKHTKNF